MNYNIKKNYNLKILHNKKNSKLIEFKNKKIKIVNLNIPSIKCISCVLFLEKINQINNNILKSQVDLEKNNIRIFIKKKYKIKDLINFLSKLGYPPNFNINQNHNINKFEKENKEINKIGFSFFCFGNIMLLTFPEYINNHQDEWLNNHIYFFRYITLILCLISIIVCTENYIKKSFINIKNKIFDANIPITLGIITMFSASVYNIYYNINSGYCDSLSGFILFSLIGKYIQNITNKKLNIKKNYKNIYPIHVKVKKKNKEIEKLIYKLKQNDIILIKNEEILPVDCKLLNKLAQLDTSFITGESEIIKKTRGEKIYAGSKNKGDLIMLKVINKIQTSYIYKLWQYKKKNKKTYYTIVNELSVYFLLSILILSLTSILYWYIIDPKKIIASIISILITACPCSLTLSMPMTMRYIIKIFLNKNIIIKNNYVLEKISKINCLVFDKTGTLTYIGKYFIKYQGEKLSYLDKLIIGSLTRLSNHTLSKKILEYLKIKNKFIKVNNFKEILGRGIEGIINNKKIKIGSYSFINKKKKHDNEFNSKIFISFNEKIIGYFIIHNYYRKEIKNIFQKLKNYKIIILSGDNNYHERKKLKKIISMKNIKILFNKTPEKKIKIIKKLKKKYQVMMIGDGINDIGAIKESDIGSIILNKYSNFIPEADIILNYKSLKYIPSIFKLTNLGIKIIKINFIISVIYNIIGLSLSGMGKIKPIISAILMPISSLTVIFLSLGLVWIVKNKYPLK